jgi:hypothetical protein
VLTAVSAIFFPYDVLTVFLLAAPKTRKGRKKRTSKILVNGFILARVNQKTKPPVARLVFFNRRTTGAWPIFYEQCQ